MAAEQVNDPNLRGGQRDAFPGKVVPPEQQTTLQRLMGEGEAQFRALYDEVAGTGRLTPDELNAILKAGKIKAELEREKYVEGIRQNPANIIQGLLKELNPEENIEIESVLLDLNSRIQTLQEQIEGSRKNDLLRDVKRNTLEIVQQRILNPIQKGVNIRTLISFDLNTGDLNTAEARKKEELPFEMLRKLGLLPADSIKSFSELFSVVSSSGSLPGSGKPFVKRTETRFRDITLENLQSDKPGLEGIIADLEYYNFGGIKIFKISATPEALARIIDRGKFVPYEKPTEKPAQQSAIGVPTQEVSVADQQAQSSRARRAPKLNFLRRNK